MLQLHIFNVVSKSMNNGWILRPVAPRLSTQHKEQPALWCKSGLSSISCSCDSPIFPKLVAVLLEQGFVVVMHGWLIMCRWTTRCLKLRLHLAIITQSLCPTLPVTHLTGDIHVKNDNRDFLYFSLCVNNKGEWNPTEKLYFCIPNVKLCSSY